MTQEEKDKKVELLTKMKEYQKAYSEAATQLREITNKEEKVEFSERQLKRLADYKAKYNFYVAEDGTAKPIDWDEVEKLINNSIDTWDSVPHGYVLGFDRRGYEGIGYEGGNAFSPMLEEEAEVKRFVEREQRRAQFEQAATSKKR
jgi:hypothetical protein